MSHCNNGMSLFLVGKTPSCEGLTIGEKSSKGAPYLSEDWKEALKASVWV